MKRHTKKNLCVTLLQVLWEFFSSEKENREHRAATKVPQLHMHKQGVLPANKQGLTFLFTKISDFWGRKTDVLKNKYISYIVLVTKHLENSL